MQTALLVWISCWNHYVTLLCPDEQSVRNSQNKKAARRERERDSRVTTILNGASLTDVAD